MKFLHKVWEKIKTLFKQGLSPKQLALSLAVSTLVSLFPVFGISSIVLTFLAIPFRLNLPIMLAFSYVGDSLKLLLLIPFIKIGADLMQTEHTLLTYEAIKASYQANFWQTTKELIYELVCGTVGWALIAIPVSIALYFVLKAIFTYVDKLRNNRLSAK